MWLVLTALASDLPEPLVAGDGAPALSQENASSGRLGDRVAWGDGADLILLFGGEQEGQVQPCGCPDRPLGGIARIGGYRAALREANPGVPDLALSPGGFLSSRTEIATTVLSEDTGTTNGLMLRGLAGWDALNLTCQDIPGAVALGIPKGAVSTNLRVPGVPASLELDAAGRKVAVLGVSRTCRPYLQPEGMVVLDSVEAVRATVPTLTADLVVVLVYHLHAMAEALAEIDGVDLVIEAGGFVGRYPPWAVGDAVWVRSADETRRIGELRLLIEDGQIRAARDRRVDLDDRIPQDKELLQVEREARKLLGAPPEE